MTLQIGSVGRPTPEKFLDILHVLTVSIFPAVLRFVDFAIKRIERRGLQLVFVTDFSAFATGGIAIRTVLLIRASGRNEEPTAILAFVHVDAVLVAIQTVENKKAVQIRNGVGDFYAVPFVQKRARQLHRSEERLDDFDELL